MPLQARADNSSVFPTYSELYETCAMYKALREMGSVKLNWECIEFSAAVIRTLRKAIRPITELFASYRQDLITIRKSTGRSTYRTVFFSISRRSLRLRALDHESASCINPSFSSAPPTRSAEHALILEYAVQDEWKQHGVMNHTNRC